MELHHLRTFIVVAEEQNVTRAAQRLFMTPPAVSAHIRALEDELNVTLFVRTPHGMQITEKGALLKQKAEQTLQAAQNLVNYATQMQDYLMGRLVIGLNASSSLLRVAPLIAKLRMDCPGIELTFVMQPSGLILSSLQSGTLDGGFIFGSSPSKAILAHQITEVDLVIAAPKAWQSRVENATWADLAELPWVCSTIYCPFQFIIEERFRQLGLKLREMVKADDDAIKVDLVSAGLGLALLERGEAEEAARAERLFIWKGEPLSSALSFAIQKERQDDPLLGALRAALLPIWHDAATSA